MNQQTHTLRQHMVETMDVMNRDDFTALMNEHGALNALHLAWSKIDIEKDYVDYMCDLAQLKLDMIGLDQDPPLAYMVYLIAISSAITALFDPDID